MPRLQAFPDRDGRDDQSHDRVGPRPVSNLEGRARIHAALGDAARLAIVDRLSLGDVAPSELATQLDMTSNLLAHHLGVLQTAGVIRRMRSEGDRRRSYVQLVMDDPTVAGLIHPAAGVADHLIAGGRMGRVMFVCTQNSARSQLAAAAWNRLSDIPATSAGTHPARRVHPRAIRAGRRHGLDLARARTEALPETTRPDDLVVAVCDNAHEELVGHRPLIRPQLHWAVPDPVRVDTDEAFETAWTEISHRVQRLADAVDHR